MTSFIFHLLGTCYDEGPTPRVWDTGQTTAVKRANTKSTKHA